MRITLAVAVACLVVAGIAAADNATAAVRKTTEIPAQGLGPALTSLAKEFDFQVLYRTEVVGALRTQGVSGAMTVAEALEHVLSGTGLTYKYLDDKTVTILPVGETAPSPSGHDALQSEGADKGSQSQGGDQKKSFWDRFRLAQATPSSNSRLSPQSSVLNPQVTQVPTGSEVKNPQEQPTKLEEILVTAQKRSEVLQNVPATINVLSGERLETEGIVGLSDYASQVPNMTLFSNGSGGPGRGEVILRGISSGNDRTAVVGMYLDEVSFTSNGTQGNTVAASLDPDLADIDRIEILEGPQSTLYGANALGGLIKIVTKQPNLSSFGGSFEISGAQFDGGGAGYSLRGNVNIPIVTDSVALRVTAVDREDPGFIDNVTTGQRNINEDRLKGVRASLLVKISDSLQTTLSGFWQDITQRGPNLVQLNATDKPLLGALAYASPLPLNDTVQYRSLSDSTNFDMGFATLTNVVSYMNNYYRANYDYSDYGFYVGLPPGDLVLFTNNPSSTRYSDEIRLTSSPGRLEWLLGGFYTNEKDLWPQNLYGTDSAGVILPASSPYSNIYTHPSVAHYDEYAAFGDLTYHFTDHIEGTVGARYSYDKQSFFLPTSGLFSVTPLYQGASSGSFPSYLATVSYMPQSNLTFYVRAANAYRPGGAQTITPAAIAAGIPPTFGPDKLWNYEIGAKGSFWDGRASFTADAYHMVWTDIQVQTTIEGFGAIANAEGAVDNGAEVSLKVSPTDGLNVSVNAAYNDAHLTANLASIGARSGALLPYSQKYSMAANVDYVHPIDESLSGSVGFTYALHGPENTAFENGVTYPLPAYDTLNLRSGLEWSKYTLAFRVDNVFNKFALTSVEPATSSNAPFFGTVIVPRTFRISAAVRF